MMFTDDLREPVDVGFAGAEIAAFYGVVEETINAVAVILIVLRGIDSALRGDGVGAPGRILKTEALNVVTKLRESRGRRSAGKPRTDDKNVEFALVGRIDQLQFKLRPFPGGLDRTGRNS